MADEEVKQLPTHHPIWFKRWFNPWLRKIFGLHIVSVFDSETLDLVGYRVVKCKTPTKKRDS